MARISCPSCGVEIDSNAFTCMHCGYSMTSTPSVAPGPRRSSRPPSRPAAGSPPMPSVPGAPAPVGALPGEGAPAAPGRPAANPPGGGLGADEVELRREGEGFTLSGAIGEAWVLFKQAPLELIIIFLIIDLLGSIDLIEEQIMPHVGKDLVLPLSVGFLSVEIVALVIQTALIGGAIVYWLKHIRGQDASFSDLGRGFRYIVPLIITNIIAAVCILAGTLLLIVPGIILAMGFYFVMHVVVDKNLGYIQALKASWRITSGYKVELFLLSLLCGLVMLLGLLACGIGVIVASPVVFGAVAISYNRLAEPGNAYLQ